MNCQVHVFPCLDDWAIDAVTEKKHNHRLNLTRKVAKTECFFLNDATCIYMQDEIPLLGHTLESGSIKLDPERVKTLLNMTPLVNKKALQSTR